MYVFSLNQMSGICEVWKFWPLKDGFRSFPVLLGCHLVVGGPKNFKLLADISFESSLQNTVLSSYCYFLCACYEVDLDDIQWNEVATSLARNFSNSWPLHLNFRCMINISPNIWFIKNSKCQPFFLIKEPPKIQFLILKFFIQRFFILLKGCYFVMDGPIDMNVGMFWETFVDLLKSMVLQHFSKYSQKNVNLNVKSRAKFNCL